MTTITMADERIVLEVSEAGHLIAVRPLTGLDTATRHHVTQAAKMFPVPAGMVMEPDGPLAWRAVRACNCVLPEHHCQACEGAAVIANH